MMSEIEYLKALRDLSQTNTELMQSLIDNVFLPGFVVSGVKKSIETTKTSIEATNSRIEFLRIKNITDD